MKFKTKYILLLLILVIGLSAVNVQAAVKTAEANLKVTSAQTTLKVGDTGVITIQGKPRTRYTINTTFLRANRSINVTQWRTTDSNGHATFNWVVEPGTTPGTRTATISGGGERIEISHTVLP